MKQKLRTRAKAKMFSDYDSNLEGEVHDGILFGYDYHPARIPYTIERHYVVDFSTRIGDELIVIEVKGIFWDSAEAGKYKHIVQALPRDHRFMFLFKDASKPIIWGKKRKDGTKMSHGEWCTKNGFEWYDLVNRPLPEKFRIFNNKGNPK